MGDPVRILDLANRLRALAVDAGLPDVPIEFIGLRPGEKQREELTVQGLELLCTTHPAIRVARQAAFDAGAIRRSVSRLRAKVRRQDAAGALAELCRAIPEYVASPAAIDMAAASSGSAGMASGRSLRRMARPIASADIH
jgi:FlaA1/EpsC-like NDP-sugar epimerase